MEMETQALEDNLEDSYMASPEQEQEDDTNRTELLMQDLTRGRRSLPTKMKCHHQRVTTKEPEAYTILDSLLSVELNNKPLIPKQAGQELSEEPTHEVEIDRWSSRILINNQSDTNVGKSWAQELAELPQASSISALKPPNYHNLLQDCQPGTQELIELKASSKAAVRIAVVKQVHMGWEQQGLSQTEHE
uniref:Uncharacterized protein n=1 Tax=Sphaerodactylus townsendi TaxID=933632 RepID=A0ACB8EK34_9SAUR